MELCRVQVTHVPYKAHCTRSHAHDMCFCVAAEVEDWLHTAYYWYLHHDASVWCLLLHRQVRLGFCKRRKHTTSTKRSWRRPVRCVCQIRWVHTRRVHGSWSASTWHHAHRRCPEATPWHQFSSSRLLDWRPAWFSPWNFWLSSAISLPSLLVTNLHACFHH